MTVIEKAKTFILIAWLIAIVSLRRTGRLA
jgi:hypothetical protein